MAGSFGTPDGCNTIASYFGQRVIQGRWWLPARALRPSSEVEVSNLVIRGRAEPHPSLRIEIEFPHRILRLREGVFGDVPGLWIEIPDHVQMFGGIPNTVILVDRQRVGSRLRPRQCKFLESFCLRVELANFACLKLGKPNRPVGINLNAPRAGVRCWRRPLRHFERLSIDLPDFAVRGVLRKPTIAILVDRQPVRRGNLLKSREFSSLRIEHG